MHLQEIFDLTLTQGQGHMKLLALPTTSCALCTCKVEFAMVNGLGDAFARKCIL